MKLFTFVGYILAISVVFWLIEASINTLEDKCESEQPGYVEQLKITVLGFIGKPPPEAPWWRPLCQVTTPDLTKNLNALFNYIIFCMVVIWCFGSAEIRKPFRGKNCRIRKVVKNVNKEGPSDTSRQDVKEKSKQSTDVLGTSKNSVVLKGSILKKTAQPRPVLLYLFWSLKDIVLKDPVIPDSVKENCLSQSIYGNRKTQRKPLDTLFNNMNRQFQNANNNNTGPTAENKLEEINRSSTTSKAEGRYDKVLLGPVAVCLQALSHVVAATFRSYGIENSAIKWSTETDLSGGPGTIRATSNSMMAEISLSELTIYRVTGVQGLIRSVSYETYLVTYNGLVRTEESSTCLYGPGWNL